MSLQKNFESCLQQLRAQLEVDILRPIQELQINQQQVKQVLNTHFSEWDARIHQRIIDELVGLGPLESLIKDPHITEIIVNSPTAIWYEQKGQLYPYEDCFLSDLTFENACHQLTSKAKIYLDQNQAFASGRWDCFRLQMCHPPICRDNIQFNIRRLQPKVFDLEELTRRNWARSWQIMCLRKYLISKRNILIIGPTGCGKTTLINALLKEIPESERVVILEDTEELSLTHSSGSQLLTRSTPASLETYHLSHLIKQALRMRPDRLVIGEIRGPEAKDLLIALSTGHSGSLASMHANDAHTALRRLEMLVQMGAPMWRPETVRQLITSCIDIILSLEKTPEGKRQLKAIHHLQGQDRDHFIIEEIFDNSLLST